VATPGGLGTASLDAPSSSLSPAATPFFPECLGGRSKSRRWADEDGDETDDDHPVTYVEAARRQEKPAPAPLVCPRTCSYLEAALRLSRPATVSPVRANIHPGDVSGARLCGCRERACATTKEAQPAAPSACAWPASRGGGWSGTCPPTPRLGARGQISAPNADGWREILPRLQEGPASAPIEPRRGPGARMLRGFPHSFRDRCFNCLSLLHLVATCWLPPRCLRCRGLSHLAKDYGRSKATPDADDRPRHARVGHRPSSLHAPLGGLPTVDGTTIGVVGGAHGTHRRRRRHRRRGGKPAVDIAMDAPADPSDDATTSTVV
jgi:hypothetical protein